jgi:DNA (cytosine-5)-methyltransferase 1
MLRVLDLFSGIGGFSLGLERTGGFQTVAFCEIEPFCRKVLRKHWPDVPIYDDVRNLTAERLSADGIAVDIICGGFPCQDISTAGHKAGIAGKKSGLWSDYARLVGALRPDFVLVENVADLRIRGLDRVLGDLASIGFDAFWDCVPASALGAPHPRDRLWLVAYSAGVRREKGERTAAIWRRLVWNRQLDRENPWASAENNNEVRSRFLRVVDGLPNRVHRLGALGNAVVPQIPELIGRAILEAA